MSLAAQIFGSPGYSQDCSLTERELFGLRFAIRRRISKRYAEVFSTTELGDYHAVGHEMLWGHKGHRLLPRPAVDAIKGFEFLRMMHTHLGPWRLAPVLIDGALRPGTEEAYFRIVRPGAPEDVGSLHRDSDYHSVNGHRLFAADETTVKCWIAVECEPGVSGLDVTRKRTLLETKPGDVVMFNDDLLHAGALNRGLQTRVSVEITLIVKKGNV